MISVLSLEKKILVYIDNVISEAGTLKYSVPKSFILELLVFLSYINDLSQSLSEAGSYLYADGTCVF